MLKPKQLKCLEMLIKGEMKDKEIAAAINVTPKTICEWKKDPEFQEAYTASIRNAIRYAGSKALKKQIELMECGSGMVEHLAAKDLLNRGGFNAANEVKLSGAVETTNPFEGLTVEELKKLAKDE